MIIKSIIKTLFIITIITVSTSAQDIYGTWLIQQQYLNDVLVFDKPYMKYEFTYDGIWGRSYKIGKKILIERKSILDTINKSRRKK